MITFGRIPVTDKNSYQNIDHILLQGRGSSLRLKKWTHFALIQDPWIFSFAVVNAGYLGLAWVQCTHLEQKDRWERSARMLPMKAQVPQNLVNEHTSLSLKNLYVEVSHHQDQEKHDIKISSVKEKRALRAEFTVGKDNSPFAPGVGVLLPVGKCKSMFSYKSIAPAKGFVQIGNQRIEWNQENSYGILDFHRATYPYHTWWKWATFAGVDSEGRKFGVNLTKNLIQNDGHYNENTLWIDSKAVPLGAAEFSNWNLNTSPWLANCSGIISLQFIPMTQRSENLNLGVARSRFVQAFGYFQGEIEFAGLKSSFKRIPGLAEDHDCLW